MHVNLVRQVNEGQISIARIDEAVSRILAVKFAGGVMTRGLPSERAAAVLAEVGSESHRALAREAVRRSLVLMKNDRKLLPLSPKGRYLVLGAAADDIGQQSGGWTISWQGTGNDNADFPGGHSILSGLVQQINAAGGNVISGRQVVDGVPTDIDAVIYVFGETPYAEGQGDIDDLAWQAGSKKDLGVLQSLKQSGVPVVAIFLSGRPRWVNAEINAADAFVVAWLPGSQGEGVADVLLRSAEGEVQYDFVGRLPMGWPNAEINTVDPGLPVSDMAFARGYGLSVESDVAMATLSETPNVPQNDRDVPVFAGGVKAPWSLFVGDSRNWMQPIGPRGGVSGKGLVELSVIDNVVQEDARRIIWRGTGNDLAQVFFQYEDSVDLSGLAESGGALSFQYRLVEPATAPVSLRMDCGWPCSGVIDITDALEAQEPSSWASLHVPVSCFSELGLDLTKVNTPFLLATGGSLVLDLAEVVVREKLDPALPVFCPSLVATAQ